ncbi:MAG: DUF2147 domain-containing protein [Rudaea sp.]|uniref:DUF2147 domain-containing protein n=1 Tax=Rudaea sp. TaxID=2136325 RepID=UPI0039E255D4
MRLYTFVFAAVAALFAGSAFALDATPVGIWRTIDDATGKPKSIVEISEANGEVIGKVKEILQSDKGPNPLCEECSGERKNQPIIGMTIIWGMKKDGDVWDGGTILDPKNGNTYGCKLTPAADGKTLQVRGFKGFSLLGRTQVWERVMP